MGEPSPPRRALPIVGDGARTAALGSAPTAEATSALLLGLPADGAGGAAREGRCNNGCVSCVTRPLDDDASAFERVDVRGREVVLRHREATLRADLPARVAELRHRGAARIDLVTNGRLLGYPARTRALRKAGVDRFLVKLFAVAAPAHDAHVRAEGAFDEALRGIEVARALGARVLVTFPDLGVLPSEALLAARRALAERLTGFEPIRLPGEPAPAERAERAERAAAPIEPPRVEADGVSIAFDRMELRVPASAAGPLWARVGVPLAYVNTGPICNIRCVYCNVDGGDDQRLYDRARVERAIDGAAASLAEGGAQSAASAPATLEFIGGEPTLHPDLAVLVGRARERGFARVSICTNGALLLRPHALDRLVEAGLTGLRFSFHDHRVEVANALADVPGLGTRYLDVASMLLARRDLELSFHRMLLARNVDALEDYVRWIAARDRTGRPLHLGLLLPSRRGRMLRFADEFPPLAALRERVASGVALAEAHGFAVTLHHLPVCVLPAAAERNAYLHVRTVHVEDGRQGEVDFEGDARRGDACAGCAAAERGCPGLVGAYFDADRSAAEAWLRPIARRDDAPT